MRYIRYFSIAVFGIALIIVAMANRGIVTLKIIPDELAPQFATTPEISVPLFIVILASILVGLIVGRIWEWMHEHSIRSEAARNSAELRRLQRENRRLVAEKEENRGDDVLALLEEAR